MTRRAWAFAVTALLVAVPATADNARQRGGGSGRGSSSAGQRHHGSMSNGPARGGASAVQSDRGGHRGQGNPGSVRRVTGAEARHPVAGTGHGWRVGPHGYYSSWPYYYYGSPYYWYQPYYYGWYGVPYFDFYWGAAAYPYGAAYYRTQYADTGSIRTLVDPEKAKVFVDGHYAGVADDFDGMFQRLYVSPGRHDITLELAGYKTHRVKVYVTPDTTIKLRHEMEKGAGEATVEDLTGGLEAPPYRVSRGYEAPSYPAREAERTPPRETGGPAPDREARETGVLRVEVRPDDASIYVDGEFYGTARRATSVTLPPGRHRIEVVRPGYRTVEREVEVEPGRTETVAIELERS